MEDQNENGPRKIPTAPSRRPLRTFKKLFFYCIFYYVFGLIFFSAMALIIARVETGEFINLSLSFERPFHTDLQNVYLDSKKIKWSVASLPNQNYSSDFAKSKIGDILNDQAGWRDAGREFIHIEPGSSSPDILFLPTTSAEVEKLCRQAAAACASYTGYDYLSLPPVKIGVPYRKAHSIVASCYVPLIEGFMDGPSLVYIVNHEAGHCMGLKHSSDPADVMGNSHYPSLSEIRLIRERMAK